MAVASLSDAIVAGRAKYPDSPHSREVYARKDGAMCALGLAFVGAYDRLDDPRVLLLHAHGVDDEIAREVTIIEDVIEDIPGINDVHFITKRQIQYAIGEHPIPQELMERSITYRYLIHPLIHGRRSGISMTGRQAAVFLNDCTGLTVEEIANRLKRWGW